MHPVAEHQTTAYITCEISELYPLPGQKFGLS